MNYHENKAYSILMGIKNAQKKKGILLVFILIRPKY